MQDFRKWPEKTVNVTSLILDPRNPRIPLKNRKSKERDLIAHLIEFDKVYELAQAISEQGFFPTEILIGLEENGKKVILEGNRRLAALKLLVSPSIAPKEVQKKFERLSKQVAPELIGKVRVLFAPSREDAAPIIVRRHTISGVERWKPAQQGQYIKSFLNGDITIEELGKRLGLTKADILAMLRYDSLFAVAQSLPLAPNVKLIVDNPRAFSFTTFERLIDNPNVPQFLGISYTDDGGFTGKINKQEFAKGFTRIVTDIATKVIDSRKLNSDEQIKSYLKGLGESTPDIRSKGRFASNDFLSAQAEEIDRVEAAEVTARPLRLAKGMIPPSLRSQLTSPRINEIVRELKSLSIKDFPNSSAVMFRVLLDVLVSNYMDTTKKIEPVLAREQAKRNNPDWYPTLNQLLKEAIYDPSPSFNLHPQSKKVIQRMLDGTENLFTINHMDQFVHNKFAAPTESDLRQLWSVWEELVSKLLIEYPPPAGMS